MDAVPPEAVPGYVVPVHRALTEHILLGGAPRGLAIANATLSMSFTLRLSVDCFIPSVAAARAKL